MDQKPTTPEKMPLEPSDYEQPVGRLTDDERLAQMGHAQELERRFSLPSLIGLCLCLMATWEALSTVISAALTSGGSPCLFYNYVLSFICTVCIAASLGELASIYPTSGGQYHWTAGLAPETSRAFASWATGWISVGGQIVLTASAAFSAGLQFQACITVNNPSYVPERWHGMMFYWMVLAYSLVMNIWGYKLLPHMNVISGVLHIAGFVGILVTLGAMSKKNTAEYVFTQFENHSGWANDGVSWLVGLQSAVFPFLGYDAASHLAEELHNPSRNVPLAMVGSVVANGLMGFVYAIVLLFASPSLDVLLATPTGFPFIETFLDVTRSRAGTTVMLLVVTFVAVAACMAGITSTSRTLWAFARDKATPCHEGLSKVSSKLHIPITAIITVTVAQAVLGFIYIGNSTAFNAVLSMAIIGMYLSYTLPIIYMLFWGRRSLKKEEYGPFRLGPVFGPLLNVVSIIWMVVAMIFSTFPTAMPVTPQNMNYSIVVMGAWLVYGGIYYVWFGRHKFEVPMSHVAVITGQPEGLAKGV